MEIYILLASVLIVTIFIAWKVSSHSNDVISQQIKLSISEGIREIKDEHNKHNINQLREIGDIKKNILDELHRFKQDITKVSEEQIHQARETLGNNFQKLQEQVEKRLDEINTKVETRLNKGFEETNKTFTNIVERLTKIDEAQKNIEALSKDVVSLHDVLSDKKARGTFGEIQLHQILSSVFGSKNDAVYELQKDLSDVTHSKIGRVDAVIYLPPPTGILPIDSKFPLDNYKRIYDNTLSDAEREDAKKKFKHDLKTRIDETSKYVIEGVTAPYAIMFVTAEAVFAEINAYHHGAIDYAHQKKVYIASPTTLFAVMTTVQAILRDQERSKLAEQIRKNLEELSAEFKRYRERWEKLVTHIGLVSKDVDEIHTTTKKISDKFEKIHKAELPAGESNSFLPQA